MKNETEKTAGHDIEKRIRDFEIRQTELERLINELRLSKESAQTEAKKSAAFYEFVSTGYFTLEPDGTISGLNSSGAGLLGKEIQSLLNSRFRLYVTRETQSVFDDFLRRVFSSDHKQVCEVRVKIENDLSAFIQLEGTIAGNKQRCYIAATDITDCRLAEETVYSLLSEKEIILKEVHHRVKNNMYNIGALLNMQANAHDDPSARNVLFDAAGRVQSMSVLYDKLYRSEYTNAVSLREYIPDLVYEIVGIFPNKKSVKIRTQIDDIILDAKILSILGILVNEIITNTMKYAFAGKSDGVITVNASKKEKRITMLIADNGKGIPENITFENSTGFGMQLVGMLAEQLGGSVRIERSGGTGFVLEFEG